MAVSFQQMTHVPSVVQMSLYTKRLPGFQIYITTKVLRKPVWDLIDKSKEEPSFPDWEKGVHPSADFLMAGIVKKELFVLRDEGIIKACAIVNSNSNKEYKKVAWKVNERDNNVGIIHALAVRYEYRGMGLATQFVKNLISYAKLENIEAIHLDVID